jgi:hypothetical protein
MLNVFADQLKCLEVRVEKKHRHDFAREIAIMIRIVDHRFGDDANEGVDYVVCDKTLYAEMTKMQVEGALIKDASLVLRQSKANNLPL